MSFLRQKKWVKHDVQSKMRIVETITFLVESFLGALLVFAVFISLPLKSLASEQKDSLSFGVVPQQSAAKLLRLWQPILTHVSEHSGIALAFNTSVNIPSFEQKLEQGEYDIAYMNPYHYVNFHDVSGYQALAKQADKSIKGILVVRSETAVEGIHDFEGQTLAFPSPAAFAASIIPRAYLREQGVKIAPKYVSSHDSVYLNVAKGFMLAGGGIMRTYRNVDPSVRDKLRILWVSKGYTPHAIATHPRVSKAVRKKLILAFESLYESTEGREALKGLHFGRFELAQDKDWDDVRALRLDEL